MSQKIFITGIDTDAGKTYAAGWYARILMDRGLSVATQKFIQTGNIDMSEDIEAHRRLMGIPLMEVDKAHVTAPIIFTHPASAQLAARLDGRDIDLRLIDEATERLAAEFDVVLIEGAGGIMAPVTDDFLTIDYIASRDLPVAVVTNSRLGSINHTLLTLEAVKHHGLRLHSVMYNTFYDGTDALIDADTRGFVERYVRRHFPEAEFLLVPVL